MIQCGEFYFKTLKEAQEYLAKKRYENPIMRIYYTKGDKNGK